ncbi:MAG TPA: cellulase family glycosylhydrolase [Bacteroidales bacterium]|nr:cellulase family glycosylhydrolase [Bacteroidales bacterium]
MKSVINQSKMLIKNIYKKYVYLEYFFMSIFFISITLNPLYSQMKVIGQDLYTQDNEKVVLRGINEMFIWNGDKTGKNTLPEIAKTGANACRLVWNISGSTTDLEALIDNCIKNKMIAIPEMHDATGPAISTKFQPIIDYWTKPEVVAIIKKHERFTIVNIANEAGSSITIQEWVNYYKPAITALRNAGIKTPLMIDCAGYGNWEGFFLGGGQELINHDPEHNIIFSVHTYWLTTTGPDANKTRLDKLISDAKAKNLPWCVGEGPQMVESPGGGGCTRPFPYIYMIDRLQQEGIGWLSWSWGLVNNSDCGSPNSAFDMTTDGKFGNWATTFAEEICISATNSIKNTSIRPASLVGGTIINVTGVSLNQTSITLDPNKTATLTPTVLPTNANNKSVTWKSNNTSVATVNSSGVVTAIAPGDAIITVTTVDGGFIATCSVKVTTNIPQSNIYNDSEFTFSANWNVETGLTDGRYMGDEHYTFTSGAYYTFTFYGNQFEIWGTKDAHHGLANVSIDNGTPVSISYKASTRAVNQLIWTSPILESGTHTIKVTAASSSVIVADKIVVYNSIQSLSQTISLKKGWNLISTNIQLQDSTIETVFAGLDVQMVKDVNGFWKKGQNTAFNSLKTITPGKGYLVNMNAAGTLTITGIPSTSVLQYAPTTGWQLIGSPFQTTTPFATYFNASNCQTIKNFDGFWQPNGTVNSITNLEPGKGYFLKK